MPRPTLPKADEIASIAKALRAEGFPTLCIETDPSGRVSITVGQSQTEEKLTPLEEWRAKNGTS